MTFTAAGRNAFPYLSAANPVPPDPVSKLFPRRQEELVIAGAWTHLASATDAATVPLLKDRAGNVVAAVRLHADGREVLTLTFDGNAHLLIDRSRIRPGPLGHARRVHRRAPNLHESPGGRPVPRERPVDGLDAVRTPTDATGSAVRVAGDDYLTALAWQELRRGFP